MYHRLILLCMALLLSACSIPGTSQPTQPPIIIIATATADTGSANPTVAPTKAPAPTSPPAGATAVPATPIGPAPTVEPGSASKGVVTFAFDAFPTYYPGIVIATRSLLEKRGYELKLVPFGLEGDAPSEEERWQKLRTGEWDVLATTLDGFARQSDPSIGAITTVIDESAGADKLVVRPEITSINDLRGKRIAFSRGSVGEYFAYYALSLAGLKPADVTLVPTESVADAVAAFTAGNADAVSAWEPDVLDAEQQGGSVLIASDKLRAILDVLVTSRVSIDQRSEAMQAFHDAWYDALRLTIDSPEQAGEAIVEWGNPDWSFVAAPADFPLSLEKLAQATLGANQIAFQSPQLLTSRLNEAQGIWANAGQQPPSTDLAQLVDGRYVLGSIRSPQLFSSSPPVNSTFLLTARVELPQLTEQDVQSAQEIAQLPLEKIDFQPESTRLTDQAVKDLTEQILPVLRSSRLYLKIEGSSAWPGPTGRFSAEDIRSFALARATSVQTFLVQQGVDPNRLIIGTLDPKFPNSENEAELVQDRIVRFTLVSPGGR